MFEQDYVMRQIRQIIKIMVKILFNVDDMNTSLTLLQNNTEARETAEDLLNMIDAGNISEAVNDVSVLIKTGTMENLLIGLTFYSHLNEKDDDYLEANDFSRDKIENGIKHLLSEYGLDDMSGIFFYDQE